VALIEPDPPGSGSATLRVAGFALLGVAAVATVIGLGTLATESNGSTAAPNSSISGTATTGATSSTESVSTSASASTSAPPGAAPDGAPPGAAPGGGPPGAAPGGGPPGAAPGGGPPGAAAGGQPAPAPAPVRAPLRVYNNSTIPGLAAKAAADFRAAGWPVEAVGNYSSGIIPTSTVYFRPGTDEEAAARQLGAEFGLRVEPRFAGLAGATPGLIVIVTNDYHGR
jgi:hypothetical protein